MSPQQTPKRPDPWGDHCSPREVLTGIPGPGDFWPLGWPAPTSACFAEMAFRCWPGGPEGSQGAHSPSAPRRLSWGVGVKGRPGPHCWWNIVQGSTADTHLDHSLKTVPSADPGNLARPQPAASRQGHILLVTAAGLRTSQPSACEAGQQARASRVPCAGRGVGGSQGTSKLLPPRLAESALGNNGLTPAIPAPSHVQI